MQFAPNAAPDATVSPLAQPIPTLPANDQPLITTYQQGDDGGPVYYITAGFLSGEDYNGTWVQQLANALSQWSMMNNPDSLTPTIKLVIWDSGTSGGMAAAVGLGLLSGPLSGYLSATDYYAQAVANVPSVGQAIANDIASSGYDPADVTLIGHSLGAQISIDAGFDLPPDLGQIGNIWALDPAGPGFPVSGPNDDQGLPRPSTP